MRSSFFKMPAPWHFVGQFQTYSSDDRAAYCGGALEGIGNKELCGWLSRCYLDMTKTTKS
jgi:hypothetical protein